MKVVTGKVRFSYPNVFEAKSVNGSAPKYSVSLIIPKSDKKTLAKIKAAIETVKKEGAHKWGGKIPANLRMPLRDGDVDRADDPAYADSYFINVNSNTKPGIVDEDLNPIMDQSEFYAGCYGRASIVFFAYNANGSRGISAALQNLQKLEDGEPLGGKSKPEDDFGGLSDDEDLLG
ncbi:MAG: DUF2815 family protein [Clostridia bacterium]|jgi:hypothetical protein|nr:DUF2815 family protein [Clostridia bacterium]